MIIPQLEAGSHGVEVVGIFFFDDNTMVLQKGNPIGERLARLAKEKGILLMMCDSCALERGLAVGEPRWCTPDGEGRKEPGECRVAEHVLEGVQVGCFPDLYAALAGRADQVHPVGGLGRGRWKGPKTPGRCRGSSSRTRRTNRTAAPAVALDAYFEERTK